MLTIPISTLEVSPDFLERQFGDGRQESSGRRDSRIKVLPDRPKCLREFSCESNP